ncbi:MAG: hypothetical protein ACFFD1_08405 [Candidatus Thorarchaeota archaeon]
MNQKYLKLMILFFVFLSFQGIIKGTSQGINDRIVNRDNYVIRFPNGGPNLQFYLKNDENQTQQQYRYTLSWSSLVEYTDLNNNGIFDKSDDTEVFSLNLKTLNFNFTEVPVNLTGINSETVTGKHFEFYANFNHNGINGNIGIIVGWWNGFVKQPYGNTFINISQNQSKYIFTVNNWKFTSSQNRLALLVDVVTTTPLNKYKLYSFANGTFSMLTANNPDGKGHRGGVIDNPSSVLVDSNFQQSNTSVRGNGVTIDLQYSFPSFSSSLVYDPTYSAVSVPNLPTSGNIDSSIVTSNQTTNGLPGFETQILVLSLLLVVGIKTRKRFLQ